MEEAEAYLCASDYAEEEGDTATSRALQDLYFLLGEFESLGLSWHYVTDRCWHSWDGQLRAMLSPGTYYQRVPKYLKENLAFRRFLLARADRNKRQRASMIEAFSRDLLFYVNAACWTYDPRLIDKGHSPLIPFITYPFQDRAFLEILDCIEHGTDLVIEKTRDMGASWMSLTAMEWLWHFKRGVTFSMISRKEDLVDAPGNPDSLFWKIDFIHRHLPDWLRPQMERRRLHFGNVDNGSTIDGESTTAAAGVGGRRTALFIDEFSRIEEGYQLLAGTADTTRCRIFNFTPWGTSNAAYHLSQRVDIRKLRLHWSEHPEKARGLYRYNEKTHHIDILDTPASPKDSYVFPSTYTFVQDGKIRSPWYDKECERRDNPREVAQMLDIDYQGSAYQFFDKGLITVLQEQYCLPAYWEGDIDVEEESDRPTGLTRGKNGPLRLWCHLDGQSRPPEAAYGAGCDISAGTGATNSCLSIINAQTGEKVAEYTSPFLRPDQMAHKVAGLCNLFKGIDGSPTLLAWEMAGPGTAFGKEIIRLGFRHIYYRVSESKLVPKNTSDTPGWYPTPDMRRVLLEQYRSALSLRQCLNRSFEALQETLFFEHTKTGNIEHKGGDKMHNIETGDVDPSGAGSNHGDRVIADALAWKMCRLLFKPADKKKLDGTPLLSLQWRRDYALRKAHEEDQHWL